MIPLNLKTGYPFRSNYYIFKILKFVLAEKKKKILKPVFPMNHMLTQNILKKFKTCFSYESHVDTFFFFFFLRYPANKEIRSVKRNSKDLYEDPKFLNLYSRC